MTGTLNRRELLRGIGAAAGVAFAPSTIARLGPPDGMIALRYNENPYGPSASALKAAGKASELGAYYATETPTMLLEAIARRNELTLDNMVLSSGSNEALQAAFVAWGKTGKIVLPNHTYTDHLAYSERMGVELVTVPLNDDLSIDLDGLAAAVTDDVSVVYVCNPNNPTGMTIDGDTLRDFCRTVGRKAVVIVDEAYNEVTDDPDITSMVDLVREGENIVVMRTFSKIFGMAGMRVGYGMARPDLAKTIEEHVMAWPNVVGVSAAIASYADRAFIRFSREKIMQGRRMVVETFRRNGIEPLPSQTNFVYADIGRNASEFQEKMAERGILIRGSFPLYPNYSRVSMGRLEELEIFDRVFTEVYNA